MPSQGPFQVKQRDSSRRLRGSWLHWETALKTKTEWGLRSWEAGRGLLADGSTVNTLLARRSQCWAIMCSLCSFESLRRGHLCGAVGNSLLSVGRAQGSPSESISGLAPRVSLQLWNRLPGRACSLETLACACCFLVYTWMPRYFWLSAWGEENTELEKGLLDKHWQHLLYPSVPHHPFRHSAIVFSGFQSSNNSLKVHFPSLTLQQSADFLCC